MPLRKDIEYFANMQFEGKTIIFEDAIACAINERALISIRKGVIDTDPLYAIFTSGTTGIPKGVLINHRSVIDLVEHFTSIFGFSKETKFGNQASFDFSVAVKDLYSTLKNGATMFIIPKVDFSFPIKLIEHLNKMQINTVIWSASVLRIVANLKTFEKAIPKHLKRILFSGEVMPNKVLNYWRKYMPDAMYVNLYGSTEITCNCTYYIVDRPFNNSDSLPIGIPFPNTDILVLNDKKRQVGEGEVGEICVRGTSLALGYYNNPQKTSEAFCQNPLNPYYPEIIYRMGDLGKYNELGELLFLSRKDNQIKHTGHRIELGEIEAAVIALEFLDTACCLHDDENDKLVLFYQSAEECGREIMQRLVESLPKYMLPNKMVHYKQLPMNKNAKIDRTSLKNQMIKGQLPK